MDTARAVAGIGVGAGAVSKVVCTEAAPSTSDWRIRVISVALFPVLRNQSIIKIESFQFMAVSIDTEKVIRWKAS